MNLMAPMLRTISVKAALLIPLLGFSVITAGLQAAEEPSGSEQPSSSRVAQELAHLPGIQANMSNESVLEAAVQYVELEQWDDALALLEPLHKHEPENLRVLSNLAFVYEQLAERAREEETGISALELAERWIDKAVELYMQAAELAQGQDKTRTAEQMYDRVLLHRPSNQQALLAQARIFSDTRRPLQAVDRYQRYLKSDEGKKDAKAYQELGRVHIRSGYPRRAIGVLQEALKLEPEEPEHYAVLARAYRDSKENDKALETIQRAIELDPSKVAYKQLLADIYLQRGEFEKAHDQLVLAIEDYKRPLEEPTEDSDGLKRLSDMYAQLQQSLEGLSQRRQEPALRIEMAEVMRQRIEVYRRIQLLDVLAILRKIPEPLTNRVDYLAQLAQVYAQLGLQRQAQETAAKLRKVDSDNPVATRILDSDS